MLGIGLSEPKWQYEVNKLCSALIARVEKIFSKYQKFKKLDYMELHAHVYKYFAPRKGFNIDEDHEWTLKSRIFFEKLGEFLRYQVHHIFTSVVGEEERDDGDVLRIYVREWNEYQRKAKMLDHVCRRTYRRYCGVGKPERSDIIYKLAVTSWRDHQFRTRVVKAILNLIERERNGDESPDIHLVKDVINCFTEDAGNIHMDEDFNNSALRYSSVWWSSVDYLSVYRDTFEGQFLQDTAIFYANKRTEFLNVNRSYTEYMKFVERIKLQVENERVRTYLPESTSEKSMSIWRAELINKHLDIFCGKFIAFLMENSVEDLKEMYSLLAIRYRADDILLNLKSLFEHYLILPKGLDIQEIRAYSHVDCYRTTTDLILGLDASLEAYRKYDTIVVKSFKNDPLFRETLDSALDKLVKVSHLTDRALRNRDDSSGENLTGAFLMAKYCDFILMENKFERKINRPNEELEASLIQIVFLVHRYLDNNELVSFQNWYWKMLAERLLRNPPSLVNYKAESLMISELHKVQEVKGCRRYAKKFRRMLAGAHKSRYFTERFKDYLINKQSLLLDRDFIVHLLYSSDEDIWPVRNETHRLVVSLPTELKEILNHIKDFFDLSSPKGHRRLTWSDELSTCEIVTNTFDKRYTLTVSAYQMAVLLQYNLRDSWSIQQLADSTKIELPSLIHTLQTLVKAQLLLKSNDDDDTDNLNESSTFVLFKDFRRSTTRISLTHSEFDTQKEPKKKISDNLKDYELSSLLMKILWILDKKFMSTRQIIFTHASLLAKTKEGLTELCKYPPKVSTIKTCLDLLSRKGYLDLDVCISREE